MNKHDWLWVALRVGGLYLLVQAMLVLPNAVSYLGMLIWLKAQESVDEVVRSAGDERTVLYATTYTLQAALYTVLGFYLLIGGRPLLRLAGSPEETS